jgi:hypothetical protein
MLNELSKIHYKWVEEMNWTGGPILSRLSLIGSEIGEASDECRLKELTDDFKLEVSDIVLRSVALMEEFDIQVDDINIVEIIEKHHSKFEGLTNLESMSVFYEKLGSIIKKQRKSKKIWKGLKTLIEYSYLVADINGFDLNKIIEVKIKKNNKRGNKDRII